MTIIAKTASYEGKNTLFLLTAHVWLPHSSEDEWGRHS